MPPDVGCGVGIDKVAARLLGPMRMPDSLKRKSGFIQRMRSANGEAGPGGATFARNDF